MSRIALPRVLVSTGCLLGDEAAGASEYNYTCARCHGAAPAAVSDTSTAPATLYDTGAGALTPADLSVRVPQLSDERILSVLTEGKGQMPAIYEVGASEAADVLVYLRATFK